MSEGGSSPLVSKILKSDFAHWPEGGLFPWQPLPSLSPSVKAPFLISIETHEVTMAMRTSSPSTWIPDWGQGEEGPWAETGLKRDIRRLAPCQALRAKGAKNRTAIP